VIDIIAAGYMAIAAANSGKWGANTAVRSDLVGPTIAICRQSMRAVISDNFGVSTPRARIQLIRCDNAISLT
jgi:hypothetical protein